MANICPICNYDKLKEPPYNEYGDGSYEICPCCGFEFGVDDFPEKEKCQTEWRMRWINDGYKWWSKHINPPQDWNPQKQLESLKKL